MIALNSFDGFLIAFETPYCRHRRRRWIVCFFFLIHFYVCAHFAISIKKYSSASPVFFFISVSDWIFAPQNTLKWIAIQKNVWLPWSAANLFASFALHWRNWNITKRRRNVLARPTMIQLSLIVSTGPFRVPSSGRKQNYFPTNIKVNVCVGLLSNLCGRKLKVRKVITMNDKLMILLWPSITMWMKVSKMDLNTWTLS